ncbi:hypothetical protein DSO57_1006379 [Entomophthora muscae]|uniref:Uncharacterized protein n=1 Tax=Entomophthora muscae TaxID=34485 RepID=A0ACC2SWQ3_9FUNG|nr:hypothetical protein DSO57_1006379 [Entomophthora muscae]
MEMLVKNHIRELEKLLKDLNLAIAKIKDIDCKVKAKFKDVILTGDKINMVSAKALMAKIPYVNSLPPLALDHSIFPCRTKKGPKTPAKPLHLLNDLAHTVDERFVLAYPVESLPLVAPSWEETLVNLDYLLSWCRPFLKTIRATQSGVATSTLDNPVDPQMSGISSSQSDLILEIGVKLSSPPEPIQQSFVPSQSGSPSTVM